MYYKLKVKLVRTWIDLKKRITQTKKDNPELSSQPTGWNSDSHQGSHNGINWR